MADSGSENGGHRRPLHASRSVQEGDGYFDPEEFAVKMIGFYPDTSPLIKPLRTVKSLPNLPMARYDTFDEKEAEGCDELQLEGDPYGGLCTFREGSIRASVFNLCSATLGAGALSLPYAFRQSGLLTGIVLLWVGGAATQFSIHLLIKARDVTGARSYEDLTVQLMGHRMGYVMEVCVIVFCFGCAVAYIIAVGDILELTRMPFILQLLGQKGVICAFFFLIMLPLSLVDSVNALRFTSFLGVVSIFYLVFAACVHASVELSHRSLQEIMRRDDVFFTNASGSLLALPVMIFAYTCQTNVFSVYHELAQPSPKRMRKVSWRSVAICFSIYLLMGTAGYLEYGSATKPNILQNYMHSTNVGHSIAVQDVLMMFASVAVVLTVVMAFPLVIFPCRFTIGVLVFGIKDGKMPTMLHGTVTCVLCLSALAASMFIPDISTVFGLMGSTASSFVCFVLPALLSLKMIQLGHMECPPLSQYVLILALAIGGSVLGIASTTTTVMSLIS